MFRTKTLVGIVFVITGVWVTNWALAQSGSRSTSGGSLPVRGGGGGGGDATIPLEQLLNHSSNLNGGKLTEAAMEEQFWASLIQSQYHNWAPLAGQTEDFYRTPKSPHGKKSKLFVNRIASSKRTELPPGSVLISENYDQTGTLASVTVMNRIKGYAPRSGDWYWTEYQPDSQGNGQDRRTSGHLSSCIECHQAAGGGDYVYANDRR